MSSFYYPESMDPSKKEALERINASIYRLSETSGADEANPLPCGCAIVSLASSCNDGPARETETHIRFCRVHEQAYEMMNLIKQLEYDNNGLCPSCKWPVEIGHERHCKLDKILINCGKE